MPKKMALLRPSWLPSSPLLDSYQKALYETFIYKKNPNNIKLNKSK